MTERNSTVNFIIKTGMLFRKTEEDIAKIPTNQ